MRLTRHASLIVSVLGFCFVTPSFVNEPIWTEKENAAHRDVIIEATVLETSEEGEISDSESLWTAVLKIEEISMS